MAWLLHGARLGKQTGRVRRAMLLLTDAGWPHHGPGLVHLDLVAHKKIRDNPKKEYQVTQKKKASWAPHGPGLVHLGHRTAWAGLHRRVRLGHEAASLLFLDYLPIFLG